MNLPACLFVLRWLVRDTFRQALAARTFWLMLAVSGLCILFCLGVGIEGGQSLRPEGEIELYGGDQKPLTGPNPNPGHLSLAFGMVRLTLFRDAESEVHFLQSLLAFWVAGTVGTLAALVWTAGFLPAFLDPGAASVLLAKPAPRWLLLGGKIGGVLAFVAFQEIVFFGGTWLALGMRTGVWTTRYLWCVPLLMLQFSVLYAFSALMAVCTRSTVASIFGAILFWLLCFGVNYARHAVIAMPYVDGGAAPFSSTIQGTAELSYWMLPKPADMVVLLDETLKAHEHFDVIPKVTQIARERGALDREWSVLSSLGFGALLFVVAALQFRSMEY